MTRSWTDPRTGRRWRIDAVRREPGHGGGVPKPGRGGVEGPPAIIFEGPAGAFAVPTPDAARLEVLEDDRLAELLDAARHGNGPQADLPDAEGSERTTEGTRVRGRGEASPSAVGRNQPHRDPVTE